MLPVPSARSHGFGGEAVAITRLRPQNIKRACRLSPGGWNRLYHKPIKMY